MKTMKKVFTNAICLLTGFLFLVVPAWPQSQQAELADKRYTDPKGYFQLVPPAGWRIEEYPDDVRGKVAFLSPDGTLRVLVNAVDFDSTDGLLKFCHDTQKRLGLAMKIEKFDFYGRPAVRRSFEVRGERFLYVDFLMGKVDHNLAFNAPLNKYDQCLPVVLKSMETYEPVLKQISDTESLDHLVAKKLRLGRLMFEADRADLALEYVREGLAVAPDNQKLLELKKEIDKQSKKPDVPLPSVATKRFESKPFGFSFNVPPKISIYDRENPGPMASRINAGIPIVIANPDIPIESIGVNVGVGESWTTSEMLNVLETILLANNIPPFEKISSKEITIGKKQDKAAVEHLLLLKINPPGKARLVLFVHNGNSFMFFCLSSVDKFDEVNEAFFDTVFKSMEFRQPVGDGPVLIERSKLKDTTDVEDRKLEKYTSDATVFFTRTQLVKYFNWNGLDSYGTPSGTGLTMTIGMGGGLTSKISSLGNLEFDGEATLKDTNVQVKDGRVIIKEGGVELQKGTTIIYPRVYTPVTDLDPNNGSAFYYRGLGFAKNGHFDIAIQNFTHALSAKDRYMSADVYFNRGLAYQNKGDVDKAITDYDKALDLDSWLTEAYYNRGCLYDQKSDVDRARADYNKALLFGASENKKDIVQTLLSKGVNPNQADESGGTALIYASWKGHLDIVKILLESGADVNARTRGGVTPLIIARKMGHLDIATLLESYMPQGGKSESDPVK